MIERAKLRPPNTGESPPMREVALYERLRRSSQINIARIDEEIIQMPVLIMECGEVVAFCASDRDTAGHALKEAEARAADMLRSTPYLSPVLEEKERDPPAVAKPKQRSEAQIASELARHPIVIRARQQQEDAKLDLALWMALMDSLRSKASSLELVSRLIISGYLTQSAVAAPRRAAIRDASARRS